MLKLKKIFIISVVLAFLIGCQKRQALIVIFCCGDSITNSSYPFYLEQKLSSLKIRVRVYNFGRNGNNSGQYLKFLLMNKDWLKEKYPDFVLLQLGTNDVRMDTDFTPEEKFYQNIKSIINILREFKNHQGKAPVIIISTIPPLPSALEFPFTEISRERIKNEINPTIKKIAKEENLHLVDNYSIFIEKPFLLPGVHPNEEGYKAIAQNWFLALKNLLKERNL